MTRRSFFEKCLAAAAAMVLPAEPKATLLCHWRGRVVLQDFIFDHDPSKWTMTTFNGHRFRKAGAK